MMKLYKCIVADPPWPEKGGGRIKRGADKHYSVIKTKEEILEVVQRAVGAVGLLRRWDVTISPPNCPGGVFPPEHRQYAFLPDPEGCHLWLWTTNNYLPWGLWLMEALGFKYKTLVTWVKAGQADPPMFNRDGGMLYKLERPGLGQYTMGQTEQLLFGTLGKAMKPASKDRPRTALMAPRQEHSVKPSEAMQMIERVSPGPRLEMFARSQRPGWDVWGKEMEGNQ